VTVKDDTDRVLETLVGGPVDVVEVGCVGDISPQLMQVENAASMTK
jgi:hypothetical protein